jgi:hypothetical protein
LRCHHLAISIKSKQFSFLLLFFCYMHQRPFVYLSLAHHSFHLILIHLLPLLFDVVLRCLFHHHLSNMPWFLSFLLMICLRKNLGFPLRNTELHPRRTFLSL